MPVPRICVVIPAHNEEAFIESVIRRVPDLVQSIVVVDDASSDATSERVEACQDPRVHLIRHENNTGVGGAVLSGYRYALEQEADIVVKLDGDGQMAPEEITDIIRPIRSKRADYTKGVRFQDSDVIHKMPPARLIGNLGLSFLVKAASGYWNTFDPTNGFTAISRLALERLDFSRLAKDYFFESSMLAELYRIGAVVEDVPTQTHYGEEHSDLTLIRSLITFPVYLAQTFLRRIIWRYFIIDFNAFSLFSVLGSLLFGFGFTFGLYHWIKNGLFLNVATPLGTIMLAALPLLLGFQLLLQAFVIDIHNTPQTPLFAKLDRDPPDDADDPAPRKA